MTTFNSVLKWPIAALVLSAGCGGQNASVHGTADIDGKKVVGGTVLFQSSQHTCSGKIENGQYTLKYQGTTSIPVGEYRVTVLPPKPERPEFRPGNSLATQNQTSESIIPEKYRSVNTSGISVKVKPGTNEIPLKLKSND